MTYALDSNIISYWLIGNKNVEEQIDNATINMNEIIIPPVTYYEIRRGFKHKSAPKKEFAFNLICETYPIGKMTISAWDIAAEIYGQTRKQGNPIEDTDILIAAFCLAHNYTLVTANIKHFDSINGLVIVDWTA
ncbi:MAG: PIN domain-containing protein [Firmicutes bacterium]|nr:PIN domain-containing protein [Bacillota bacterium]